MASAVGHLPNVKVPKNRRPLSTNPVDTWDAVEKTMSVLELITNLLNNGNYDDILFLNLTRLMSSLPQYGPLIEEAYQGQLDRAFKIFRDACRDDHLSHQCRVKLMALIERRAMNWQKSESFEQYYKNKIPSPECEAQPIRVDQFQGTLPAMIVPTVPLLAPGEQIKSSGRFPQPTRVPGKNYFKDEVVINNADSGKVMGIKGRRVHMIEELSETIISFQRVTPGVKERLVQITGPNEVRINEAIHLMGDTIRRNASPVPFRVDQQDLGSSSSVNSSASEESNRIQTGHHQSNHRLQHSFSTNDASPEYKHTVTVGPHTIKLTGTNYDLVTESKIILERHFGDRDIFLLEDQSIPDEINKITPLELKQTIPQPLFPEGSKAIEMLETSMKLLELSGRQRLPAVNAEEKTLKAPRKYVRYSRDMMYALANSKLSTEQPENWESVCPAALIKVFHQKKTIARTVSDPQGRPASLNLTNNYLPINPSPVSKPQCGVSFETEENWDRPASRDLANYSLPTNPSPVSKPQRRVSFETKEKWDRPASRELANDNLPTNPSPVSKPQRRVSFEMKEKWDRPASRELANDNLPTNPSPVSKPQRRVSFEMKEKWDTYSPVVSSPAVEHVSTSSRNEPSVGSLPSPTTTIGFRPNFKFSKKASLPEMTPALTSPIPFNHLEPAFSLNHDIVNECNEIVNPKQPRSFRSQVANREISPCVEPSMGRSPPNELGLLSPTTTIAFRPNFKFSKKASLPEMTPAPTSPIPFNRSESALSLDRNVVDDSNETVNPKQTRSFRPQLTNPKLEFLNKSNPNNKSVP